MINTIEAMHRAEAIADLQDLPVERYAHDILVRRGETGTFRHLR